MKLYSTLSRKVEPLQPLKEDVINLFVCGPTVYDYAHLGHAKTYIQMDVLARTLRASGYEVFYLQNITDVDDKIIQRAQERNISWEALRADYESSYKDDMVQLNNTTVSVYARATDHIPDIISQVQRLLDMNHAYRIDDGIYFEISTFPDYGKLSGRQEVQENDAQTRIDQSNAKRGWNDFCLWKFSKAGEPVWAAPFGDGRPGWHIEDTAITEHFFGPQYDIHGGAIDLIFPHHEAELTQMEALSKKTPFVGHWVHTGFLTINDAKMSKSLKNFFTIREVLEKGYNPLAIRMLMLQSHYRSSLNFAWELLAAADQRLRALQAFADLRWQLKKGVAKGEVVYQKVYKEILTSLTNDLNTPQALATLSTFMSAQEVITEADGPAFIELLERLDAIFGLSSLDSSDIASEVKELIAKRELAREAGNWDEADRLRGQLKKHNLNIRDTALGAVWERI